MEKSLKHILLEIALKSYPEMVIRAHQIQKNCFTVPKEIRVYVKHSELTQEEQEKSQDKNSIDMACPVVGYDPYKMTEPFLIQLPNGSTRWTNGNHGKY